MFRAFFVSSLLAFWPALAWSQGPAGPAVTGRGTAESKRPAEALRVQVDLLASGPDLKAALARFRVRREAARAGLAGLGAAAEAIQVGEPVILVDKTDCQLKKEIAAGELGPDPGRRAGLEAEPPGTFVLVAAPLRADIALRVGSPEDVLVAAHALQEKIRQADLGGTRELVPASESAAPGQLQEPEKPCACAGKPGRPSFLFVRRVSPEERGRMLAEAFAKAKGAAGRLAQAAGAELGPLHLLRDDSQRTLDIRPLGDLLGPAGGPGLVAPPPTLVPVDEAEQSPDEAVGLQPGQVTLAVSVTAAFAVEARKEAAGK